jgi:hypothetical protein
MNMFVKYLLVAAFAFFAGIMSASALDQSDVAQKILGAYKSKLDTMGNVVSSGD